MRLPGTTLPSILLILIIDFYGTCYAEDSDNVAGQPLNEDEELPALDSLARFPRSSVCSSNLEVIPESCCTGTPSQGCIQHNGRCMLSVNAEDCDIKGNMCPHSKHCTCCISCDGPDHTNDCKSNQGTCRKTCEEDEYSDAAVSCSHEDCKCCKKQSDVISTCAGGTGRCVRKAKKCPRGYYASPDHLCQGNNRKCCIPCSSSCDCSKLGGFCEGEEKKCPLGFRKEKCRCPQRECKCCSRRCTQRPFHRDGGRRQFPLFSITNSKTMEISMNGGAGGEMYDDVDDDDEMMMGQEELAQEVEDMENEVM